MTRTRSELNALKIKYYDIITAEPSITNAEICRRCGISEPTGLRWKKHFRTMTDVATKRIAEEIEEKTKGDGSLLLIIKKWLKIK